MKNILIILALLFSFIAPEVFAKDNLVLMPLRLSEADKPHQSAIENAIVQGLQKKYSVLFGEQVVKKTREIFSKESNNKKHKECDETRCMQDIAIAFQAELIAVVNISHEPDGYFLSLSIQNIFDNKSVFSNSVTCQNCTTYQVIDRLKELNEVSVPEKIIAVQPRMKRVRITENEMWAAAEKENTVDSYMDYLDVFPNTVLAGVAIDRINELDEKERIAIENQKHQ